MNIVLEIFSYVYARIFYTKSISSIYLHVTVAVMLWWGGGVVTVYEDTLRI